jgi:hypothetical protein
MKYPIKGLFSGLLCLAIAWPAFGQRKMDSSELPDFPEPKQAQQPQQQDQAGQSQPKSPIASSIGLIAKRSYVFPDIAFTPGPLTPTEKFELFLNRTTSAGQIFSSVAGAAIGQARDSLPGYGQGWSGYGDRFGSSLASAASTQLFQTYLLASMFHDDPRYFVSVNAGWKQRVGHALKRVVVIRSDEGGYRFNVPGTLGPLMAEGLANVYLPDGERTAGKTFERFGVRLSWIAAGNLVREYWPTIFHSLRINKVAPELKPEPQPPPPGDTPHN